MQRDAVTEREVARFARENKGRRAEMPVGGPREPGLAARTYCDGVLRFVLRYRDADYRQRVLSLGPVSLSDARDEARGILARARRAAQAREGTDPAAARDAAREAERARRAAEKRTLESVVVAWLGTREGDAGAAKRPSPETAGWRPGTRRQTWRLFSAHWIDAFGKRDPNTIQRREIRAVLGPLEERAPSEARHAFGALRALYRWLGSERQEHFAVSTDPTAGMDKPGAVVVRSRTYNDDELRAILRAAPVGATRDQIELLMCTGTRDQETRGMRWTDVDLERGVWTIPAELSKSRRAHAVALSSRAVVVLKRRPRFGEFVFPNPATRTGYVERSSKELRDIAIGAGLLVYTGTKDRESWEGEALRLHDIRRTVGDRLRQEFGEATMHGVLGHTDANLTRTYGPTPRLRAIADAVEWWAGELARILGGAPRKKTAAR